MNLFFRSSDLYTHYLSTGKVFRRRTILPDNREMYAEVALDSTAQELADRLFTYRIPESLQPAVLPGSRVLVPFGRQDPVAGFVVSVKNECPLLNGALDSTGKPIQIKSIIDLLDDEPLFGKDYIEFLYWTADYYLCTISEVIAAAIPSAIGPRVKRYVRLGTEIQQEGMLALPPELLQPLNTAEQVLVDALERHDGEIALASFADKCRVGADQFQRAFASLKRRGRIETVSRMDAGSSPKLISKVIWTGEAASTDRHRAVVDVIRSHGGSINLTALLEAAKTTRETLRKMEKQGVLTIAQEEDIRDPLRQIPSAVETPPPLTEAQDKVVNALSKELLSTLAREPDSSAVVEPWLLHGVTGSGKTEIYLQLIQLCLSMKRSSLLLVPEISLTPQLSRRLLARFGEQVAIWHSALSAGERYDTWRRVQSGELRVVLGARSAVLANIPDLGLIILDEEHDGSYKQTTPSPRYSAKKLAVERARREGALVIFGSATPDAATYFDATANNKVLELPERVHKQALPESVIVDMRKEFKAGNRGLFSEVLQTRIAETLDRKEQVILLMNRRGYASHVFCRACGHVVRCRNCSVSLVFHNPSSKGGKEVPNFSRGCFTCHHCGFSRNATEVCPSCQSPFLRQFGLGTQRVEEEANSLFPESRILRLDSDITVKKGAAEAVFKQFAAGEADILIGTQMIAKGIDIPRVTLVGVIAADAAFNLPDYRSLERGFQLLTQVSGRAGRGHALGSVVLQTFNPDLPALDLARKQDYKEFITAELECRKDFSYPPFSELIRIVISALDETTARTEIEYLAEELSNYLDDLVAADAARILGPAPCLVEKLKNYYRYHLLIKNLGGQTVRSCIATFLRNRRRPGAIRVSIDIDPLDLV